MSMKILASNLIGLEAFCCNPVNTLASVEHGTVAVFDNNQPVFYVVTPERLAQLLEYEAVAISPRSDIKLDDELIDFDMDSPVNPFIPRGKFRMYEGWQPDNDFVRLAAVWGIILTSPVTSAELASFITYWKTEGKFFYHTQWLQKLARSIQQGRMLQGGQLKRDLNHTPEPDQSIPDGFRG
ncbi:primosomal protein DnaT [Xenorhabdus bovienii]|uniref:Replication restart protein DnaT n=1 Tax=Xenorhabdus bovienii str. puntauvense TaxID=1398201 RepID=A0A077N159_XENBV|nr:primosomal protein DnaT [Xenorhabdus bovienii]MDE9428848.1 primosomal protein DnaT [Xenorhabdus bovienii]CDG95821.1 DNA biosynthesis protein (primosomal protein I) [Xenorhabdus bovienii str. puntauvense]